MGKWAAEKKSEKERASMNKGPFGKAQKQGTGRMAAALLVIVIIAVIAVALFALIPMQTPTVSSTQLQHFSSYNELADYFKNAISVTTQETRGLGIALPMVENSTATGAVANDATGSGAPATSYSTTNVQVAGVDEADIIKNDGKYIYAIAQGKLFIVDAYPAENAKIISTIDLNQQYSPTEMFVSSDSSKLLLFASSGYYGYGGGYPVPLGIATNAIAPNAGTGGVGVATGTAGEGIAPAAPLSENTATAGAPSAPVDNNSAAKPAEINSVVKSGGIIAGRPWRPYGGGTTVLLYDISNKEAPTLEKEIDFDGAYLTARLIGDNAYFVINSYPMYYAYDAKGNLADSNNIIPLMRVNGSESKIAEPSEIGIMPSVRPTSFVTIASLNLATQQLNKQTVTASAQNVYASQNNLYFADNYWDYSYYQTNDSNGPIPPEVAALVRSIYYPVIRTVEKTVVDKFSLSDGKISFAGQGIVPGTILNQFSMDEYNDNFRIATTVSQNWSDPTSQSKNNVYILDKDMNMAGSIESIAPGEKIYSARFLGDKGYLVTFKSVDPLFVLDLSNPANPTILGKLKIPGYSDYMQPIDETHILGIGKDVNELEDAGKVHTPGAVYYTAVKGIKMAIFDVSDVTNPVEMYNVVIGDRGTDSEALTDHKALLFDKDKQLLVLPIDLVEYKNAPQGQPEYYEGDHTFQGAIVYNVSLDSGFTERGRITHVTPEEEMKAGYYYDYTSQIRRSLYMDNVLYTFSNNMIKANALDTLSPVSEVAFPQSANSDYYGGVYYPMSGMAEGAIANTGGNLPAQEVNAMVK